MIYKKNIQEILETTAEQDHVTVELENAKELVGKDLTKHIKNLENQMNEFAAKLEFEDAATGCIIGAFAADALGSFNEFCREVQTDSFMEKCM